MRKNYTSIFGLLKKRAGNICLLMTMAAIPGSFQAQAVYSFNTAGATGPTPPTQSQITASYPSSLTALMSINAGIQTFTVPSTGPYRIAAVGAQGGYNGGNGAYVAGDFTLTAGTVLKILVGQQGSSNNNGSNGSGGGGGGTYVTSLSNVPYVVAGGGGGNGDGYNGLGNSTPCCRNGMEATVVTTGNGFAPSTTGGTAGTNGGSGGNGGTCAPGASAGSGAGITGNGVVCNAGSAASSFVNGGAAGLNGGGIAGDGGFGGGGGCYNSGTGERGGGGGGYSGGGGGTGNTGYDAAGGGGGSYVSGANQTASLVTTTGNGKVTISLLCDIRLIATTASGTLPAICTGQSATLTTNGVSGYSWSTGATTSSIVVNPTSNTLYSVTATSSIGCVSSGAVTLTVSTVTPTMAVTSSTPATCLGNTVVLNATGAISYSFSSGIQNGVPFLPTAGANNYTVSGFNGCGSTTSVIPVTISQLPISTSASSTLVCAGTPATLTAGGAANYTWTPVASLNPTMLITAPNATTIYTITGNTGSCSGQAFITVTTKPNPTITIAASNTNICSGNQVNLTANSNATTFNWSTNQSGATISDSPSVVTLYGVTAVGSNGCSAYASQVVVVRPLPTLNLFSTNPVVCSGGGSTLSVSGASTYAWSGGSTSTSTLITVNPTTTTDYSITGTSSLACSNTSVITVSVFNPPITISNSPSICIGGNGAIIGVSAGDSYAWSNGQTSQNISVNPAVTTLYTATVMVNNLNGIVCPITNSVSVVVNPGPSITASTSQSVICLGNSAVLTASGAGAAGTYTWVGGPGAVFNATNSVAPVSNLTYSVMGTDVNGCKGMTTIQQQVSLCTGISVNSGNTANLTVYPNPSNGEFTISSDQTITLNVTNELGQHIKVVNLDKNNSEAKVNNLANGIYFISGKNENGSVIQKIIIAK